MIAPHRSTWGNSLWTFMLKLIGFYGIDSGSHDPSSQHYSLIN
jgi:hypothetical protein